MPNDVRGRPQEWIASLLCAGGVYLYIALLVDPSLTYGLTPWFEQFSPEKSFFLARMGAPGGPAQYIASLIADFYLWRWMAALLLTVVGMVLTWQAGWLLECIGGAAVRQWRMLLLLVYLLLLGRYSQQLASVVGLVLALAAAQVYLRAAGATAWRRTALLCLLAAALSWTAAGLTYVFVSLAIIFEVSRKAHRLQVLLYIMAAEGIPYLVGMVALRAPVTDAFLRLLPFVPGTDSSGWYALTLLILCMPALSVAAVYRAARSPKADGAESPQGAEPAPARAAHLVARVAILIGLLLIGFDHTGHRVLLTRQLARQGRWEQVITEARGIPDTGFSFGTGSEVNRALAETGRLPYEMFTFLQNDDSLALYNGGRGEPLRLLQPAHRGILIEHGDLALRMGLTNDAEHQYHEALEMFGTQPDALLGLARVNIAKGNLPAAFIFLRALARDPAYHFAARDMLANFPNAALSPAMVHQIRSTSLSGEREYLPPFMDLACLELLKAHPDDRFAFEYLMAYYLLKRDLKPFMAQLYRLDLLGYSEMPTHYQEAILMHAAYTGTPPQTGGYWLSPDIVQRSVDFLSTVTPLVHADKGEEAKALTCDAYGNTYFYYFTFGTSGGGRR